MVAIVIFLLLVVILLLSISVVGSGEHSKISYAPRRNALKNRLPSPGNDFDLRGFQKFYETQRAKLPKSVQKDIDIYGKIINSRHVDAAALATKYADIPVTGIANYPNIGIMSHYRSRVMQYLQVICDMRRAGVEPVSSIICNTKCNDIFLLARLFPDVRFFLYADSFKPGITAIAKSLTDESDISKHTSLFQIFIFKKPFTVEIAKHYRGWPGVLYLDNTYQFFINPVDPGIVTDYTDKQLELIKTLQPRASLCMFNNRIPKKHFTGEIYVPLWCNQFLTKIFTIHRNTNYELTKYSASDYDAKFNYHSSIILNAPPVTPDPYYFFVSHDSICESRLLDEYTQKFPYFDPDPVVGKKKVLELIDQTLKHPFRNLYRREFLRSSTLFAYGQRDDPDGGYESDDSINVYEGGRQQSRLNRESKSGGTKKNKARSGGTERTRVTFLCDQKNDLENPGWCNAVLSTTPEIRPDGIHINKYNHIKLRELYTEPEPYLALRAACATGGRILRVMADDRELNMHDRGFTVQPIKIFDSEKSRLQIYWIVKWQLRIRFVATNTGDRDLLENPEFQQIIESGDVLFLEIGSDAKKEWTIPGFVYDSGLYLRSDRRDEIRDQFIFAINSLQSKAPP